jgi:hypothetical protein
LNILRTKLRASPQEILHSCQYKESSYVKILNSCLLIECTIIGHSQRKIHESKFQSWKGQLTFFENFDLTLVIVSNLHHVDSLSHLKRKTCEEKLITKWTTNKQLRIMDVKLHCDLFNTLVHFTASYACQVWVDSKKIKVIEVMYWRLFKSMIGVRKITSTSIMLVEFDKFFFEHFTWGQALLYYNCVSTVTKNLILRKLWTRSPWPSLWHVANTRGQSIFHDLPFI